MKILSKRKSFVFLIPIVFFCIPPLLSEDYAGKSIPKFDPETFASKKEYLLVIKGREFANKSNYSKAIELFSKAIQLNPRSTAYYWKGLSNEKIVNQMVRNSKDMIETLPPHMRDAAELSNEQRIRQYCAQTVESYQKAAEVFSDVDYLHYQLGKAALDYLSNMEIAEQHLLRAIELKPREMVYRAALAHFYLAAKRFSEARKESETALTDSRTVIQSEAHGILGRTELEQKNFSRAIEELELSLSLNPGNFVIHFYLAKAFEGRQSYDQAMESLSNFQKLFSPETLNELSILQESKKNLERLTLLKGGKIKK